MRYGRRFALRSLVSGLALLTMGRAARASASDPVIYTYDALGRLTSAAYPSGVTINYTYDAAGNRTQVSSGSTPPPPPPGPLSATASATTWFSGPSGEDSPIVVTVTGGTAPYYYTWQRVSGNPGTQATNPNGTPNGWIFTGTPGFPWTKVSTWRCQVTDSASTTVYTSNVTVTIDVS